MRIMLLVVILVSFLSVAVFPSSYYSMQSSVARFNQEFLHSREVNISGQNMLGKAKVLAALNQRPNNLIWKFDPEQVLKPLKSESIIENVRLTSCSFWQINCFNLSIKERQPAFLANMHNGYWLLGADGSFLHELRGSADTARLKRISSRLKVPIVSGLNTDNPSSAVFQSRCLYIKRSLDQIHKNTNLQVKHLEFVEDGDLRLRFYEYHFSVRFSASYEKEYSLQTELVRLNQVLDQVKAYRNAVEEIDLAYNKVAVIRLTEKAMGAKASLKPAVLPVK